MKEAIETEKEAIGAADIVAAETVAAETGAGDLGAARARAAEAGAAEAIKPSEASEPSLKTDSLEDSEAVAKPIPEPGSVKQRLDLLIPGNRTEHLLQDGEHNPEYDHQVQVID